MNDKRAAAERCLAPRIATQKKSGKY